MSLLVVFIVSLLFCFVFVSGISGDGGWWGEHSGSLMGKCLQHATSGEYLSEAACHTSKALLHRPEKRLCHVWTFVWGPNILRLKYQSKYLLTESKSCHYKMGLFCGQPLTSQQRVCVCHGAQWDAEYSSRTEPPPFLSTGRDCYRQRPL